MDTNPFGVNTQLPPQQDPVEVDFARSKVQQLYSGDVPSTASAQTASAYAAPQSVHRTYMQQLQASGMSLADIQTAWHNYYMSLDDTGKTEIWNEFYSTNQASSQYQQAYSQAQAQQQRPTALSGATARSPLQTGSQSLAATLKDSVVPPLGRLLNIPGRLVGAASSRISSRPVQSTARQESELGSRFQSLSFGISMGGLVLLFMLFSFFNEFIIAPFIQPSRKVGATPIILSDKVSVGSTQAMLTVSKVNIQVPIDFTLPVNDQGAVDEALIQKALENGIIHYTNTTLPGQNGNGAYFGHSSMNIFNAGNYKFAFATLHQVNEGDTFFISYNGKMYAYRVSAREIVSPSQVSILNDTKGKQATAVLVTCHPPGFNTNRMVVWGEQISPSLTANTQPAPVNTVQQEKPQTISSNNQRLWSSIIDKITFWN